jgi:O-methyltransferase
MTAPDERLVTLYVDLLKRSLLDVVYDDHEASVTGSRRAPNWPARAHTMIGAQRLDNVEFCARDVLRRGVPGDFIETGVWRGGATILMRGVLQAYGITDRTVWVADSFAGLPPPDPALFPDDAGDRHHTYDALAVPLSEVQRNFDRYGLLDQHVRFLEGWFRDTLPHAPIERLAVLRLDGDMYESTMVALEALYPKLSAGGYCIADDYGAVPACARAVDDFRARYAVREPMRTVDWTAVYWMKEARGAVTAEAVSGR